MDYFKHLAGRVAWFLLAMLILWLVVTAVNGQGPGLSLIGL